MFDLKDLLSYANVVLAGVTAVLALYRGRIPIVWFVIGLILPGVSIIILIFLPINKEKLERNAIASGEMKRCWHCNEMVRRDAIKCKHCGEKPDEPTIEIDDDWAD